MWVGTGHWLDRRCTVVVEQRFAEVDEVIFVLKNMENKEIENKSCSNNTKHKPFFFSFSSLSAIKVISVKAPNDRYTTLSCWCMLVFLIRLAIECTGFMY